MDKYQHHVSGFFAHREEAEGAFGRLVERGIPRAQMQLLGAASGPEVAEPKGESNDVLSNVLVDGAIGTAVGTGIGALALVAGGATLFVASPLVAPLVLLGWGASLGAFVGAAAGATKAEEPREGWLADMVQDAIANGQVVLVIQTFSEDQTATASEIVGNAVGEFQDVATPLPA